MTRDDSQRRTSRLLPFSGRLAIALALAASLGCAQAVDLRPAASADQAGWLERAAVDEVDGISVVAQGDAWPGDPEVKTEVTPVRVVIENESDVPVRVRYQEFALVSADGSRYAALPPFAIDGEVSEEVVVRHTNPVQDPLFVHTGFEVASYTGAMYPRITQYRGTFLHDPTYYAHYHDYWVDFDLPTETMLRRAMPEGVVSPGGRVEGFLYFEHVDSDDEFVRFRADLVKADDGDYIGEISIPFLVE